jgi:TPR repeat protein
MFNRTDDYFSINFAFFEPVGYYVLKLLLVRTFMKARKERAKKNPQAQKTQSKQVQKVELTALETFDQGKIHLQKEEIQKALSCFENVDSSDPLYKEALKAMAHCYRLLKKPHSAFILAMHAQLLDKDCRLPVEEMLYALKDMDILAWQSSPNDIYSLEMKLTSIGSKHPINLKDAPRMMAYMVKQNYAKLPSNKQLYRTLFQNFSITTVNPDCFIEKILDFGKYFYAVNALEGKDYATQYFNLATSYLLSNEPNRPLDKRHSQFLLDASIEIRSRVGESSKEEFPVVELLAALKDPAAAYTVGTYYNPDSCLGTMLCKKNLEKARRYFELSAKLEFKPAYFQLGELYVNHYPQENKQALIYLKKAEENGFSSACYLIGNLLLTGTGIDHDFEEGVRFYRKAIVSEDSASASLAKLKLGQCYFFGLGVKKDIAQAESYLNQVGKEHAFASYLLGVIALQKTDLRTAQKHFEQSKSMGCAESAKFIDYLNLHNTKARRDSFMKAIEVVSCFNRPFPRRLRKKTVKLQNPTEVENPKSQNLIHQNPVQQELGSQILIPEEKQFSRQKRTNKQFREKYRGIAKEPKKLRDIPESTESQPEVSNDEEINSLFDKAQNLVAESLKNKSIMDLDKNFKILQGYAQNLIWPMCELRVYDFFQQKCLEYALDIMKSQKCLIKKRMENLHSPSPELQNEVCESMKFINELYLFYNDLKTAYEALLPKKAKDLGEQDKMEIEEVQKFFKSQDKIFFVKFETIKVLHLDMTYTLLQSRRNFILRLGRNKILADGNTDLSKFSEEKIFEIGQKELQELNSSGFFKLERSRITQSRSTLNTLNNKLKGFPDEAIAPKACHFSIQLSKTPVSIFKYLISHDLNGVLTGSYAKREIMNCPFFESNVAFKKKLMGNDYDFNLCNADPEKLKQLNIHPTKNKKDDLFYLLGFGKAVQLYFFNHQKNPNLPLLIRLVKGIFSIDEICIDATGNVYCSTNAYRDLIKGTLSLVDKDFKQFNVDPVRILYAIKYQVFGFTWDKNLLGNINQWLHEGVFPENEREHFKAVLRSELSKNEEFTTPFMEILLEKGILEKVFKVKISNVTELLPLIKQTYLGIHGFYATANNGERLLIEPEALNENAHPSFMGSSEMPPQKLS